MAYGLNRSLFIENGPAIRSAEALSHSSSNAFRAWSRLDAKRRFELVEKALKHANDRDGLPIAL
jgi:hypothetical protein